MRVRYSFKVTGTLAAFSSWKKVANIGGSGVTGSDPLARHWWNDCKVLARGLTPPALCLGLHKHRPQHLAQHVAHAGALGGEEGEGADHLDGGDADAGGERAVEGAFAEAAGEAAQDVLAEELAEQVVGERDAACGDDVGEDQLRQPQQAEEAGAAAVERGEAAQQAQVLDQPRR